MNAGGEREHLTPILKQIGLKKLTEIDQRMVDKLASERGNVAPATLIRQIYTPITAVLNFAAPDQAAKVSFKKPKVRNARTDYLTPDQAEAWIEALPPYLSRLVVFYLATGCRASEALTLDWKDVSPKGERVVSRSPSPTTRGALICSVGHGPSWASGARVTSSSIAAASHGMAMTP